MSAPSQGDTTAPSRTLDEERVKQFMDSTLLAVVDDLSKPDGRPSVTLKRRSRRTLYSLNAETGALEVDGSGTETIVTYSWPGKTPVEAWRFGVVLRILGQISQAIQGGFVASKRDIYYADPEYFGSQKLVDTYIDDIAYTIGVNRTALHVAAAAKGLTAGCYKIRLNNGDVLTVGEHAEGMLIPRVDDIAELDLSDIQWILVIEKEAVFHRLVTSKYYKTSVAGAGILMTGKGYPDLSTRAFLRLIAGRNSSLAVNPNSRRSANIIPIHILVDNDPDGMAIMSTYKYGSIAQAHENANLSVSNVQWLGLRSSNIAMLANAATSCTLIPLSLRDRKKAQAMLLKSPIFTAEQEPEWKLELQRMLMANVKAEIEALYEHEEGLEGWLDRRLRELN